MTTRRSLRVCAISVMLAGVAWAGELQCPDFERATAWKLPQELEHCRVVDDDGASGQHSLRFALLVPRLVGPAQQEFACRRNQEYVLTAAFKCEGKLQPMAMVSVPGEPRKINIRMSASLRPEWHTQRVRFNSGPYDRLMLSIYAHSTCQREQPAPAGRAWVDDVDVLLPKDVPSEAAVAGGFAAQAPGPNLALGKPYALGRKPNYSYCTEPGDRTQLTDGAYSVGYFWVQKSTVGWTRGGTVPITIDLGRVEPIAGVSFSSAAGVAGVSWPAFIAILVSEDGKHYYNLGDLLSLSSEYGLPEPDRYSTHRFMTDKVRAKARFVQLLVKAAGGYAFCDEIEIYRGEDAWLAQPMPGEPVPDPSKLAVQLAVQAGVAYRLRKDLADVADAVAAAALQTADRTRLRRRLAALQAQIDSYAPVVPDGFRAVVPLNDLHAEILRINAALLRARGLDPITLWHKNRWDMLAPTEAPERKPTSAASLTVAMMDNAYRAETLNITNATDQPIDAALTIRGLPGGTNPKYVVVHQVEFVDTQAKVVIADALPIAPGGPQGFQIKVPAGMTRQVWLTFHPQGLPAGTYRGQVVVDTKTNGVHRAALTLKVYPLHMPDQPTCSLGLWDYTDGNGAYDITPSNRAAAIQNMREHFVDTPWARSGTAPRPQPTDFDREGNLVGELNFDRFDQWAKDWAGARNYYVFLNMGDSFAGTRRGTLRFERAVADWARAWAAHNAEIGLKPGQVGVLIVDEPKSEDKDQRILDWATAIKQGTSDITIWEDPVHHAPWAAKVQGMFDACDVLCPNLARYIAGGDKARRFYAKHQRRGAKLWFYQCSGPGRLHDPYYYHRLQHWHCWVAGAVGSGFWAYGDAAGTSPWNDYAAKRTSYTPAYIEDTSVTDGKHWEAVREGIQDYECLRMLRDRIEELAAKGASGPKLAAARQLLEEGPKRVAEYSPGKLPWVRPKDRSAADQVRVQVLEALAGLAGVSLHD